jgi:hypothetical protein
MLRLVFLVAVAALALGIGGRIAIEVGGELPHGGSLQALGRAFVALGAPWLVVAWGVGAVAADRLKGALAGGVVLALGTAAWYWLSIATGGRGVVFYAVALTVMWGAVGLLAGSAFGFAGALWRTGEARARAFGLAPAAGALAGEAVLLSSQWGGRASAVVLALEAAGAVALLVAARRHAPIVLTLACFCVATAATAQAESGVRDTLRAAGWAGR